VTGIVRSQAPLLCGLALTATATGLLLRFNESTLFAEPWLLALVPVINAIGGNLGAVLGARLTSALHLGTMEPKLAGGELVDNLSIASVSGLAVYSALAVTFTLAAPYVPLFPPVGFVDMVTLVVGSGLALTACVIGLSLASAFVAYRRGLDPDDVVVPIVTNLADLLGVLILVAVSGVVL
jgi:mgtE-like transporter